MQSGILCHLIGNAGPPCPHLEMRIWCQDSMSVITARVAKAYCQVVSCYIALQFNYGGRAVDVIGRAQPSVPRHPPALGLGLIEAFFRGNVSIWQTYNLDRQ